MKEFFKYVLATITGMFLSFIILGFVFFIMIAGMMAFFEPEKPEVKDKSVLELSLHYDIPERTPDNPFEALFSGDESGQILGLDKLIGSIEKAKDDDKIKGIYLKLDYMVAGFATLEELRDALLDFKSTGKFIYCYANYYSEKNYYLASVSDSIFMNPSGEVVVDGISANITFLKGLFDKMGVEMQLIKVGKYKGAGETFCRNNLSEPNKEQISRYIGELHKHFIEKVSQARKIDREHLRRLSDDLLVESNAQAIREHLIDGLLYEDQVKDALKRALKLKKEDKTEIIKIADYAKSGSKKQKGKTDGKIAVIYAVGEIGMGNGDDESIGAEKLVKALAKARDNEKIKAVVLRINSPGGSALASDIIWREVVLCKAKKPVIVSMGDIAASGGYFIAAPADTIVAQPNTLTGSIGVFMIVPNMKGLLNDKLGINLETVNTGKYSDLGRPDRALNEEELRFLQRSVNRIYDDFTGKVEQGRNLDSVWVDSIAQGRIWVATDAVKVGLVDVIGGLNKAVEIAAWKAGLKNYKVVALPKMEHPLEKLFQKTTSPEEKVKQALGEYYLFFNQVKNIRENTGMMQRLPFLIDLN